MSESSGNILDKFFRHKRGNNTATTSSRGDNRALVEKARASEGLGSAGQAAAALIDFRPMQWSEENIHAYQNWLLKNNMRAAVSTARMWWNQEHAVKDPRNEVERLLNVLNNAKDKRAG